MSDQIQIGAELRTDVGKGASRRLRRLKDRVPGILYGGDDPAVALSLATNELSKAMEQEAFYSQVLDLHLDNAKHAVIVRDVQRHPAEARVLHIDFLRVSEDKEIQVNVPLHFINEDKCVGVKMGGGNIAHSMTEVEISALPRHLPEFIEVDMENVEINQVLHLSDLTLPPNVTIVALTYGEDHDHNVASVQAPRGGADEDEADVGAAEDASEGDAEGDSSDES